MGAPVEIADGDDLCSLGDDPEGEYVLVDDVDVSGVANLSVLDTEFNRFDGTLDGNGHAIEGVTIDRPEDEVVGPFDVLGQTSAVRNLELRDVSVTVDGSVGAVAGRNSGLIEGCRVTGRLSGGSTTGGVTGQTAGTVEGCRSAAAVAGIGNVGGLVGHAGSDFQESGDATAVRDSDWDNVTGSRESDWDERNVRVGVGATDAGYGETTVEHVRGLATDRLQGDACREDMPAFDFEETWCPATDPPGYPVLSWEF